MESIFYKSTRQLKILGGGIVLLAGLLAAYMTFFRAWPSDDEKAIYYGFYMMISYVEVISSVVLSLLIYIFADMLDCLRHIQENADEICAALKKEPKPED